MKKIIHNIGGVCGGLVDFLKEICKFKFKVTVYIKFNFERDFINFYHNNIVMDKNYLFKHLVMKFILQFLF